MKAEGIDVGQSPAVRVSVPQERRMPVCRNRLCEAYSLRERYANGRQAWHEEMSTSVRFLI